MTWQNTAQNYLAKAEARRNADGLRVKAALTALQGIIEAKGGFIAELDPALAAQEAFRIADKFVEYYLEHYK